MVFEPHVTHILHIENFILFEIILNRKFIFMLLQNTYLFPFIWSLNFFAIPNTIKEKE